MALDWNEYQKQAAMQKLEIELALEARREQAAFDAAYPLESLEREKD